MELLPILIAGVAAGAILLIFLGLTNRTSVDPVQARLTQLGAMQAKNLEELELQQPFLERTLTPLANAISGRMSRIASSSFQERTEKQLALAGNPGNIRTADWLGVKAVGAVVGAVVFALLFIVVGFMKLPVPLNFLMPVRRPAARLYAAGVLARWAGAQAPARDPAPDPGRARPADDLRPGRPRLRRRARQGRREAPGSADRGVPARAGRGPRRQGAPRGAPRHRASDRGPAADQLHRRDHPGRAARRVDLEGPPGPVGAAPDRAPAASRGDGGQGADQDAVPARRVHLPVAVHRHPRARPSS